jgi:nucleoside 2-deoxyribosyltransferase
MVQSAYNRIKAAANGGMIYLASPYSHLQAERMAHRFEAAARAAGLLMLADFLVFSPISHTHPIAVQGELPRGWDFWHAYDRWFIERCACVVVLQIEGWAASTGVNAEVAMARELGKPVEYVTIFELDTP